MICNEVEQIEPSYAHLLEKDASRINRLISGLMCYIRKASILCFAVLMQFKQRESVKNFRLKIEN